MKKLKYILWLILIIFLGLVVYQNLAFFSSKHVLQINLGFYHGVTPELTNGAIIAIFVGISVLIMMMIYMVSRYNFYRAKKNINALQAGIDERDKTIAKLTQEVELLKGGDGAAPAAEVADNPTQAQEGVDKTAETQSNPTP